MCERKNGKNPYIGGKQYRTGDRTTPTVETSSTSVDPVKDYLDAIAKSQAMGEKVKAEPWFSKINA